MKIKNLMLKNFAKVSEILVNFDENITYLIGTNGAGKTTIGLNAIWFIFKGLAQKGDGLIAERFRFIGPGGKSAQGVLTVYDEANGIEIKIIRKLLKNKTELKIEASDGRQLDQAWLDSIFNSFLIDPFGFSRLPGKEQALAFGADTYTFDRKKKELEIERRDIGRDVKRLQGVVDSAGNPEKIEAVDVAGLMECLRIEEEKSYERTSENNAINRMREDLAGKKIQSKNIKDELEETIKKLKDSIKMYKDGIDALEVKIKGREKDYIEMPEGAEQEIKDQIENAQEINLKAADYQKLLENKKALEDTKLDREGKNDMLNVIAADRVNYLKSLNLPWPNITITDEGEFRLNDKPFCSPYFSTGEILKFGARIGSKLKDGLKYVYFPCSNNLDDKNREATFKTLIKDGFQIVAEYVGTERKKDASILLKEMKVVESYDESEGDGLK